MPDRHFPVRPDLARLEDEAEDLHRAMRRADPGAIAALKQHHPASPPPGEAALSDARLALARMYGLPSWSRLVQACLMIDAIWSDDLDAVRELIRQHPHLLHENARGIDDNWGPPMSYAANLGRKRIIEMLRGLGASDLQRAFDRACLQGQLEVARYLYDIGARPEIDAIMGPAETQNGPGMALLLELGAPISDIHGDRLAPVALMLETYSRNPPGKHQCLELLAGQGIDLPDTPPMAVHRGRADLLEGHLHRDPALFSKTFTHKEIYPPELGCHKDESLALHGTPLAGATLLHLCVDNDEIELARWMLNRGADPNARAAVDPEGFGGHTALFGCVVSQPFRVRLRRDDAFARLLLEHGASTDVRASLRKRLRFVEDESTYVYADVTPLAWGRQFHDQTWVNGAVMHLLETRVGDE